MHAMMCVLLLCQYSLPFDPWRLIRLMNLESNLLTCHLHENDKALVIMKYVLTNNLPLVQYCKAICVYWYIKSKAHISTVYIQYTMSNRAVTIELELLSGHLWGLVCTCIESDGYIIYKLYIIYSVNIRLAISLDMMLYLRVVDFMRTGNLEGNISHGHNINLQGIVVN